jgi:hypothetical protein
VMRPIDISHRLHEGCDFCRRILRESCAVPA